MLDFIETLKEVIDKIVGYFRNYFTNNNLNASEMAINDMSLKDIESLRTQWLEILDQAITNLENGVEIEVSKGTAERYKLNQAKKENTTSKGDVKNSIEVTDKGFPVVVINDSAYKTANSFKNLEKIVKRNLNRFKTIRINKQNISINKASREEITNSKYSKYIKKFNPQLFMDKMDAMMHQYDIISAAVNFVNESQAHERNDNIVDFTRGNILLQINGRQYKADVIFAYTTGNIIELYDLVNIKPTSFKLKTRTARKTETQNSASIRKEQSSNKSISNSNENVNKKFSKDVDVEYKKAVEGNNIEVAREMVIEQAKRNGYTLDLWHETNANRITTFDLSRGDNGGNDWGTPVGIFTKTSNKNIGIGKNQMHLFAKANNTLFVENRQDLRSVASKNPKFAGLVAQIENIDKKYNSISEKYDDQELDAMEKYFDAHEDERQNMSIEDTINCENLKYSDEFASEWSKKHKQAEKIREDWKNEYNKISAQAKAELTKWLKDNGYDSVYLKLDEGSFGRKTDAFIFLNPNQVKLAETITYDDNGTLIQLSKRFNEDNNDIRYSKDVEYEKQVDMVLEDKFPRYNSVYVADTPVELEAVGLNSELPLLTSANHIKKATMDKDTKKHQHGLTVEQVKQLPKKIKEHVMLIESLNNDEDLIVVTDMIDEDNSPIIVSIHPDGSGEINRIEILSNFITSYYGRDRFNNFIKNAIKADKILFVNKEKATILSNKSNSSWLESLQKNYDFDIIIRKLGENVNKKFSKDVDVDDFDGVGYNIINTTGKKGYSELKREVMTWDDIKYLNQVRCVELASRGFYIYKMLDNETHDILVYRANTPYAKRQQQLIKGLYGRGANAATVSVSRLIEDYRNSSVDDSKLSGNKQRKFGNNADVHVETLHGKGYDNGRRTVENDSNDYMQEGRLVDYSIDVDSDYKSLIKRNKKLEETVDYLKMMSKCNICVFG